MLLFCSTMHFASGQVRRKTFQFVPPEGSSENDEIVEIVPHQYPSKK